MRILSLDLATKTGWCYWAENHLSCGTWTLATAKEIKAWGISRLTRRGDPRVSRLRDYVSEYCGKIDILVHEDVMFSSSTLAVQMFSALRSAVWLSCADIAIREALPVQTLKVFATGAGNATKEQMMKAVQVWNPERFSFRGSHVLDYNTNLKLDDNACDALHLARWAHHNLARAKT